LGERDVCTVEVVGSNPIGSTSTDPDPRWEHEALTGCPQMTAASDERAYAKKNYSNSIL
jgi:hypothetical protein